MDWAKAIEQMKTGEYDVIDTIFPTQGRRAYLDFASAHVVIKGAIFFRNDISGITSLESLRGMSFSTKKGDLAQKLLQRKGIKPIDVYDDYKSLISAVKNEDISIFVAEPPPGTLLSG